MLRKLALLCIFMTPHLGLCMQQEIPAWSDSETDLSIADRAHIVSNGYFAQPYKKRILQRERFIATLNDLAAHLLRSENIVNLRYMFKNIPESYFKMVVRKKFFTYYKCFIDYAYALEHLVEHSMHHKGILCLLFSGVESGLHPQQVIQLAPAINEIIILANDTYPIVELVIIDQSLCEIPNAVRTLHKLKQLVISHNTIAEVPEFLKDLAELERITIVNNNGPVDVHPRIADKVYCTVRSPAVKNTAFKPWHAEHTRIIDTYRNEQKTATESTLDVCKTFFDNFNQNVMKERPHTDKPFKSL